MNAMTVDPQMIPRVIDGLVGIKNKRDELTREFKAKEKVLKEQEERGENWLLLAMQQMGVDQLKAHGATAYVQTKQRSSIGDWSAFSQFVAESGEVDLLQHRLNEANLQSFVEANQGLLPPGVATSPVRTVTIKRS